MKNSGVAGVAITRSPKSAKDPERTRRDDSGQLPEEVRTETRLYRANLSRRR
jgi:hypothetical protein